MRNLLAILVFYSFITSSNSVQAAENHTKNFTFSPITLLFGVLNAGLDFKMNDTFAAGPEAGYLNWKIGSTEVTAYSIGVNFEWQPYGLFKDGLYVSPAITYASAKAKNDIEEATAKVLGFTTIVGYHWYWDSFNMALGGGFRFPLGDTEVTYPDGSKVDISMSSFAIEYNLGFTF